MPLFTISAISRLRSGIPLGTSSTGIAILQHLEAPSFTYLQNSQSPGVVRDDPTTGQMKELVLVERHPVNLLLADLRSPKCGSNQN